MLETLSIDQRIKLREVKDLLETPRVIRVNDFTEETVKGFSMAMSLAHRTGQPIIPIVIDSYGGDVYSLLAMIDIMKTSPVPIATILEGKGMSCGAALFACGTPGHRYISPSSSMMIHDMSVKEPNRKIEEIKVSTRESDRVNRQIMKMIDTSRGLRPGSTWKQIHQMGRVDWYLTPKQAVAEKLADHIGLPVMRTSVIVDIQFGLADT